MYVRRSTDSGRGQCIKGSLIRKYMLEDNFFKVFQGGIPMGLEAIVCMYSIRGGGIRRCWSDADTTNKNTFQSSEFLLKNESGVKV